MQLSACINYIDITLIAQYYDGLFRVNRIDLHMEIPTMCADGEYRNNPSIL